MQIRTMEKRQPPVRVIVPGKVYRRDNPDATHSFIFHQVEGLAVDTDITFCDFTGTIEYFVKQFFGPGVKTRFRPSYFPFTEPSVEFDVSCPFCGGSGTAAGGGTCSKCKGAGWIELFGAGMVDPAVYGFVNYDRRKSPALRSVSVSIAWPCSSMALTTSRSFFKTTPASCTNSHDFHRRQTAILFARCRLCPLPSQLSLRAHRSLTRECALRAGHVIADIGSGTGFLSELF